MRSAACSPTKRPDLPLTTGGSAWIGAYNEFDPHNPNYNPSPIAGVANDDTGHYLAQGLRPGIYYLGIDDSAHVAEIYDDLYVGWQPTSGAPVTVLSGQTTTIDIDLLAPGQITGDISNAATGAALVAGVEVFAASGAPAYALASGSSNAAGHYSLGIGHLATGVYYVRAKASGFQTELYHDVPCPFEICPPGAGLPIAVTAGATTSGVDFALTPIDASLLGRITYQGAHNPQLEILHSIQLFDTAGTYLGATETFGCPANCSPPGT